MAHLHSRRQFLRTCAAVGAIVVPVGLLRAAPVGGASLNPHPTPRAGITAAKVLTKEQLAKKPKLVALFDSVREIPEVIDGIRCNCGCAQYEGFYSLLSCYEGLDAMAKDCVVCQGQGRLAARLHKAGKSLDDIRSAIDAKFG